MGTDLKIRLSCLFSFLLFNNGNYQDYQVKMFLELLVFVVFVFNSQYFLAEVIMQNTYFVIRRSRVILNDISNSKLSNL